MKIRIKKEPLHNRGGSFYLGCFKQTTVLEAAIRPVSHKRDLVGRAAGWSRGQPLPVHRWVQEQLPVWQRVGPAWQLRLPIHRAVNRPVCHKRGRVGHAADSPYPNRLQVQVLVQPFADWPKWYPDWLTSTEQPPV